MGQYFIIMNLTKKQCIKPSQFDDGSKLVEFGASSQGTMFALSSLLASGNGRGGGDLFSSAYRKAMKKWEKEHVIGDMTDPLPNADVLNNPLIGSWAGDRIVIGGDYISGGIFLTSAQKKQLRIALTKEYQKDPDPNRTLSNYIKGKMNLYEYAKRFFEDISPAIIKVFKDAQVDIRDGSNIRNLMAKRKKAGN